MTVTALFLLSISEKTKMRVKRVVGGGPRTLNCVMVISGDSGRGGDGDDDNMQDDHDEDEVFSSQRVRTGGGGGGGGGGATSFSGGPC